MLVKFLSSKDLIDLGKHDLIEIGCHTHTHQNLKTLDKEDIHNEIINSKSDDILLESKAIQLSIHPFDLSKVALKSNLISILVNKDNLVFDIDMNSVLSIIFVDQNNLHNLNSAINNIKISGNDIFLANLDQVHIKINENNQRCDDLVFEGQLIFNL